MREMCPRVSLVDFEGRLGLRLRLRQKTLDMARPIGPAQQHPGQQAMSLPITPGSRDCAPTESLSAGPEILDDDICCVAQTQRQFEGAGHGVERVLGGERSSN
jgi:hypothetical protein